MTIANEMQFIFYNARITNHTFSVFNMFTIVPTSFQRQK